MTKQEKKSSQKSSNSWNTMGFKGSYDNLKATILTDEVFVELEIKEASGLILTEGASEEGFLTRKARVILIGEKCSDTFKEKVKRGTRIQLRYTVDLEPTIDVSHTNVPHPRFNPNCKIFTFSDDPEKNKSFKKYPTALVHEWDIIGTIND